MSRMRQIPVMDIHQREKILTQNNSPKEPVSHASQCGFPTMIHPMPMNCRPCFRKPQTTKMRLSDTPALIRSGCNSVREFCNGVQHITVDLNHLVSSVESMLPLLTTYLSVLQNRNALTAQELAIEAAQTDTQVSVPEAETSCSNTSHANKTSIQQQAISQSVQAIPRLEDIQQLLENPLIHNLLNNMIQNGGIPNVANSMRNADANNAGNRPDTLSHTN